MHHNYKRLILGPETLQDLHHWPHVVKPKRPWPSSNIHCHCSGAKEEHVRTTVRENEFSPSQKSDIFNQKNEDRSIWYLDRMCKSGLGADYAERG